ncbi:MAG: EAL domain-containing protein [Pleomorphochaeta sp.]
MIFNYAFNATAFVFILILTVYYNVSPIFPNRANKLFSAILIEGTISVFLDVLSFICINNKVNIQLNYIINFALFITQWMIPYLLFKYVMVLTKQEFKTSYFVKVFPLILLIINYSILLSSPITHYVFYFTEDLTYMRGTLFNVSIIIESSILLWGVGYTIIKRKHLSISQFLIIPSFITLNITSIILQILYPHISIISASVCVSIYLMYFTLLKPTAYIDTLTNLYNRVALNEYIYTINAKKQSFSFIVVDIVETSKINSLVSEDYGNEVIKYIATELSLITNNCLVFRLEGDKFVLIFTNEKDKLHNLEIIKEHFPLLVENIELTLTIKIHLAYSEKLYENLDISDIIELINFISNKSKQQSAPQKLNSQNIEEYRYNKARNNAISDAILNENIEIRFQPIYDAKRKECTSAEILSRIYTKEFGYINPEIFIRYAENKGIISLLTLAMIKKVCIFLSTNEIPKCLKNISINLSVMDCLDSTIQKKILSILNQYNIDKKLITFEITESTASLAPQLENTMIELAKEGITFSMDDFGTGYANLDSVLRLPFSKAKFDKTLLNLALQNEKYKVLLSSLVSMIKNLNLEIIVEGVETKSQVKYLSNLEVDYFQGFYFSKPLTDKEFIDFIKK